MSGLHFGLSLSMQGRGGRRWLPSDVFLPGDNGFLYDFSRADTLFQEATGITPAGLDQNVGLALDISKWGGKTLAQVLAGQAELRAAGAGTLSGGWTESGGVVTAPGTSGSDNVTFPLLTPTIAGRRYEVTVPNNMPANGFYLDFGSGTGSQVGGLSASTQRVILTCTAPGSVIRVGRWAGAVSGQMGPISVKEIPTNPASQATSGARPISKAGGLTRYDGSDDNLLTTLVPSAAMTLAVKLKVPAAGPGVKLFMGATHPGEHCYLGMVNSGALGAGVGSQTIGTLVGGVSCAGQTGVAVLTYDSTTVKLYWNGAQVYSGATSGDPDGATPLRLGARNNGGTADLFADADIYKALAINRALTPAEVLKLTNAWSA